MKRYRVRIIEEAEQDLIDIYRYVVIHDSAEKATYVLDQLESLTSVGTCCRYSSDAWFVSRDPKRNVCAHWS